MYVAGCHGHSGTDACGGIPIVNYVNQSLELHACRHSLYVAKLLIASYSYCDSMIAIAITLIAQHAIA